MTANLKKTLTLPKTRFPMRANLVLREPQRLQFWEKEGLYRRIQEKNANGRPFILHDGPPFTNGFVHMGTVLNKVLKEIILRYKSMRGFRTPYVAGWDCHGLPIEHKVMLELRNRVADLSALEIRQACAQFSKKYLKTQRRQFTRLGVLTDWSAEYRTMDPAYEADILRTFASFIDQGAVYRSKKPVYWSIPCRTALAEAEIEYKEHLSPSIWVKFVISDASAIGIKDPVTVVIWTTTPWTLPANLAIAVHPRLTYSVLKSGEELYLVARDLVEPFARDTGLGAVQTVKTIAGEKLEGLVARHPFLDRPSPIILANYVTTEAGTGAVHTAPGHGLDDYLSGLAYNLEIYSPLDDEGKYANDGQIPPELVGVAVLGRKGRSPANEAVVEMLAQSGGLMQFRKLKHSYPHCWRSKTPVVFRAMDQWFVAMDEKGLRQRALQAIGDVEWIPAWGENRIRAAVENRPDWCISRQRSWGVPIPAFFDAEGKAYIDAGVVRSIAKKIGEKGSDYWFENDSATILEGIDLPDSWKEKSLARGGDTLDVWIDSGSSSQAVLKRNEQLGYPADLYLEGSDQHRGWFQSSLWAGMVTEGIPPYKQVLTHGYVVKEDGTKMSKSDARGRPQTADTFIEKYGADVIRLWVSSQDYRNDIPFSPNILNRIVDTYRLFRNTLRFQLSNLSDFDMEKDGLAIEQLDLIDRWALHKTAELVKPVTQAYDTYAFHRAYQLLNQFFSVTLSARYHDMLKDRLYTLAPDSRLRRSSQTAIYHIFRTVARLMAPVLAFSTDEAWSHLQTNGDFSPDCIHLQSWPRPPHSWTAWEGMEDFEKVLNFRNDVNELLEKARQAKRIGKSLDANISVTGSENDPLFQILLRFESKLPEVFIASRVSLEASEVGEVSIEVAPAEGERCPRCWRTVERLVETTIYGSLCPRCQETLRI
ncbi:MAG: isoleucine--tRNA ligase [Opitutae bacterium]|nr:isoleucine--tRNA ligase [Opitutae bacterium]